MLTSITQEQTARPSRLGWVPSFALAATMAGFFIVSYIPATLGVESRAATVPFRALMLAIYAYAGLRILLFGRLRLYLTLTSFLVIFFWTAYCSRFIVDAAVLQVPLGIPASDMALYLFGIVLPAFIVFYLIRDIRLYRRALTWTMLSLMVCCVVSMLRTQTANDVTLHGGGYQANEVLNHILYGHMGVTAIILGLFTFLRIGRVRKPWYIRILAVGAVGLGVFTVLASGSRGALVAGLAVVPVAIYLGLRRGSTLLTVAACLALVPAFSATAAYLSGNGMELDRVMLSFTAYGAANNSVYEREGMYRDALRQYQENPLTGSSIVERNSLSYPHNAILEAYMATGTFGGTALLLLVLIAAYRGLRLINSNPETAWIPLCFFQQLIAAMFSGGLYGNMYLWSMMAIVLGADIRPQETLGEEPEPRPSGFLSLGPLVRWREAPY